MSPVLEESKIRKAFAAHRNGCENYNGKILSEARATLFIVVVFQSGKSYAKQNKKQGEKKTP